MIDDEYETEEQIQKQVRFAINMEDYYEIVIKYQDKEKVITRDDFVDSNKMVGSQYIKGSRMWAFEMLNKGKKIRNIKWEDLNIKGYIYIDEEDELMTENDSSCTEISYFKDGWELYKPKEEEKKTMTLREAIEQRKNFKFHNDVYKYVSNAQDYHGYEKEELQCENEIAFELNDIINNLDEQVELIKE